MRNLLRKKPILNLVFSLGLLTLFSPPGIVAAQPLQSLTEHWRNTDYGFTSKMLASDAVGNTYVLGDTAAGDYLVVKKFSATGSLLWQTVHDPTDRLRGVWLTVDGEVNPVVLASTISGSNATPAGWHTLKYSSNGNLLWSDSLPGGFADARRAVVDAGNNIYVAGRMWLTNASGNTTHDSVLIKYYRPAQSCGPRLSTITARWMNHSRWPSPRTAAASASPA